MADTPNHHHHHDTPAAHPAPYIPYTPADTALENNDQITILRTITGNYHTFPESSEQSETTYYDVAINSALLMSALTLILCVLSWWKFGELRWGVLWMMGKSVG